MPLTMYLYFKNRIRARQYHVASLMLSNSTTASRVQPEASILPSIASKEIRQSVCCLRP